MKSKLIYKISWWRFSYLILDAIIIALSYFFSYLLRFYPELNSHLQLINFKNYLLPLILIYLIIFYFLQIYRILWRYSNSTDLLKLEFANIVSFIIFVCYIIFLKKDYSRLTFLVSFFLIYLGTTFYRVMYRLYIISLSKNKKTNRNESNILIIGAGEAGRTLLSEFEKQGIYKNIIGFIDDDKKKIKKLINGKIVIGSSSSIINIVYEKEIDEIIIAMPSAHSKEINKILKLIEQSNRKIKVRILPSIYELDNLKNLSNNIRDINITDIVGRDEVDVNMDYMKEELVSKVVLITGAGGSIGSEICNQLKQFNSKKIIAVGRGEFSIYNLIKDNKLQKNMIFKIADIKNKLILDNIFKQYKPDIVFHTAAHKHVPLMEFNEVEAINNNFFGTKNVLDCCKKYKIEKFVLVSTDKAVNPTNIMGATKRLTELLTLYYNKKYNMITSVVRFGNVLGSRGSVIPLFDKQIKEGGPVTVTHKDIKRFFMSIPEAAMLVLNSSVLTEGGETFILDMGELYSIDKIARNLIKLNGLQPDIDIKIEYTGLRPGEKLYEELNYNNEKLDKTTNKKINKLSNIDYDFTKIQLLIEKSVTELLDLSREEIRELIKDIIEDYDYSKIEERNDRFVS